MEKDFLCREPENEEKFLSDEKQSHHDIKEGYSADSGKIYRTVVVLLWRMAYGVMADWRQLWAV